MADVQVKCINKQPRNNPHEGITHLGGMEVDSGRGDSVHRGPDKYLLHARQRQARRCRRCRGAERKIRAHARGRLLERQFVGTGGMRSGGWCGLSEQDVPVTP
jgi:hypothetical protein